MENWDDDEPQPDCFLSTVGAVSHSDCSNDGSNGITQAINDAPATLSESNASCSFSRIEVETGSGGGAIPEDTLANFENNEFTSAIDNSTHDYLLNSDFYGAASSSFCNNTSSLSERRYAPSSYANDSPAVSEIIQEMESTNIGDVASTIEKSMKVLKQMKSSTPKSRPLSSTGSTSKTNSSTTKATPSSGKMSNSKEEIDDSFLLQKAAFSDPPAPVVYEPTIEEQEVMRRNKIFAKCHVALTLEDLNSVFRRDRKAQSMCALKKDRENRQKKRKDTSKGTDENRTKKSEHRRSSGSSKTFSRDRAGSTSPVAIKTTGGGAAAGKSAVLKRPKKFTPMATCCVCKETIDSDQTSLPSNTSFCSKECVQKQVRIAMQCVKPGEAVMLMDLNGMVLNESKSPKIEALESFLMQYPNFQPVLNTNNIEKKGYEEAPINDIKSERKRVEVRKVIEHHLQLRCKSAKMSFSSKRVKQMCVEIEEELFRLTREINSKYRNWCRGLLQKLKDESNVFFRKIINEKISVKKLVTMDPEDMNSTPLVTVLSPAKAPTGNKDQSLASASKNDNVSAPSNNSTSSDPTTTSAAGVAQDPIVLEDSTVSVTGVEKLVENIDFDLTSPLASKQNAGRYSMAKKTPMSKVEVKSTLDNILDDAERDTTGQHNSHLYDANCEICKNKTRSEVVLKERAERMEAKLEAKRQQEQEELKRKIPRFPNLDSATKQAMESKTPGPAFVSVARRSSQSSLRKDDEPEDDLQDMGAGFDDDDDDDIGAGGGQPDKSVVVNNENAFNKPLRGRTPPPPVTSPWVKPPRPHLKSTNLPVVNTGSSSPSIDQYNSKPAGRVVETWKKPALVPPATPLEADNPWLRNNPRIWTGSLSWGRRFDFPCSLTAISNRLAFKLGREMPPVAKVVGRIEPTGVWEYIRSLRDSWSKQVIVLLVEPPTSREHQKMYMDCYELMRQENRYGVIEFASHPTIRDGYIFALEPEEPLPKDLHPVEGPGLPDGAEQNSNIILVIIRKVDRQENMAGRSADKKSESWKNESWRVDGKSADRQPAANDMSLATGDSTPLYSEVSSGVRPTSRQQQQPIRQMPQHTPYLDSPRSTDNTRESRGVATMGRKPSRREIANNGYTREKRVAENMVMRSECEESGVVKTAAQNAYDGPIDTLQDVLKAISVIEKPSLIVIVVGEYISSHSISEEEREIISQAIKDKSESERLRNQKKFGMQFSNNNREDVGAGKYIIRSTPPGSADEEVDNEELTQTDCTKLAVDTTQTEDVANPAISRSSSRDSGNSSTNDSTKAQQISFGDSLFKESGLKQQQSPPASSVEVGSREEESPTQSPPPPPPATPPMSSAPSSPPPPPAKITAQPVVSGPVPIAPPTQPSFHCLPLFVPPPPPAPTAPKIGPATTSKSRPNEDMDISDEEGASKNTGDLLPPPPPPPTISPHTLVNSSNHLPACSSGKPFYSNFQTQPIGSRPTLIRPTRGMPAPGLLRGGLDHQRPQTSVRLQMSLEGDIYPATASQRKSMPDTRPRAANNRGEVYGGDDNYEPPLRRMKFPPVGPPHPIGGNNYDVDNTTMGQNFAAQRTTPPGKNFHYPQTRPRFGVEPNCDNVHNYSHVMEMEQGVPFGHRNPQTLRGRNRMPMNHFSEMGPPRPGWNSNDNFQSPPRFGPNQHNQMRGMRRAPTRGQMNNFY